MALSKNIGKCVARIAARPGGMGEDKAREYLAEIAAAFEGKEREHFDLEKVLETVDNLKQEKVPEPERIYLNSLRSRLLDVKKQQMLIGVIESKADASKQPGTALKSVVEDIDMRVDAYAKRKQGELNAWAERNALLGMPDDKSNELLKTIFDASKGRKVEGDFKGLAKEFLDIVEEDRLLLNAHGGDVNNIATLLFNEPLDTLLLAREGGLDKFKALWTADKFEAKDLEVLQAKIAKSPEFLDVMTPHKERMGKEKQALREAAAADITTLNDGKSLHSTQHTTRKQAILDSKGVDLERLTTKKDKLGADTDAKLKALAEEASTLQAEKTAATSKLRKKADAEKLATVKAQFEAKASKISEKRALLAASHTEAKAKLAEEVTLVEQKADEAINTSRVTRDEGLAKAVKDKEAVLAELRKETAPTEAFAKLSFEERFTVLQEAVYKILTKEKSVFDTMPQSDTTLKRTGGMVMPKNMLKEVDNRNLIPFSNHEDYRAFMWEFGTQNDVAGLINHATRNARLTTLIREFGSTPTQTLERLSSWFNRGKTESVVLKDLSLADRKRLSEAEASNDTKEIVIQRDADGNIVLTKVVFSRRTGRPLEGVKFDELGEIIPESLPLFDPTNKTSPQYTMDQVRVDTTAIVEPNLTQRILSLTSGVSPQLLMDTPENIIRGMTGELFTKGSHPELANTARRANALANMIIMGNNLFSQLSDGIIGGSAMARLRDGGMSRQVVSEFTNSAGSQFKYTSDILFKNLFADQRNLAKIEALDKFGVLLDSYSRSIVTSSFDGSMKDVLDLGGRTKFDAALQRTSAAIDKMNLISRMNYAGRVTALETVFDFATNVVGKDRLTAGQLEMLTEYGLTKQDFVQALEPIPGRNDIQRLNPLLLDVDKRNLMTGFVTHRVEIATGMPNARTQLIRSAGHDINTVPGALAYTLTNLMSYQITFATRVLPDIIKGSGAGGVIAMTTGLALMSLVTSNAKRVVNGQTVPDYEKHPMQLIRDAASGISYPILFGVDAARNIVDAGIAMSEGRQPEFNFGDAGATITTLGDTALPFAKFVTACAAWGAAEIPGYLAGTGSEYVNAQRAAKLENICKDLMYTTNVKAFPVLVLAMTKDPKLTALTYALTSAWMGGPIRNFAVQEAKQAIDPQRYSKEAKKRYNRTGQRLYNDPLPPENPNQP
jgi:hypothetical protein